MHRSARRRVGEVLHPAGGAGRRSARHHHRGPGPRNRGLAPHAGGIPPAPRPAVRLLHAWHGHGGGVAARRDPRPDRGPGARGPRGQPVPLHRLPQHRQGGAGGGVGGQGRLGGRAAMIPAKFDYYRADSADEAISLLGEHGEDAKLLAGGHSLLPLMKLRLATPSALIDVGRLSDLSYVRDAGDHIAIGALTRHRDLQVSPVLATHVPVLAHVAGLVGDPQVRHRGTIGGSLAHGDPASDLPAVVLALGGTLVARGPGGERQIDAGSFFRGFLETALAPDELLVEIRVPKCEAGWSYQKFNRRAQDWAIVGAVATRYAGGTGVALVNMGPTPVRAAAVESALASGAGAAQAAEAAAEGTEPTDDLNASPEYRRHLARTLVRRALEEAGL